MFASDLTDTGVIDVSSERNIPSAKYLVHYLMKEKDKEVANRFSLQERMSVLDEYAKLGTPRKKANSNFKRCHS